MDGAREKRLVVLLTSLIHVRLAFNSVPEVSVDLNHAREQTLEEKAIVTETGHAESAEARFAPIKSDGENSGRWMEMLLIAPATAQYCLVAANVYGEPVPS